MRGKASDTDFLFPGKRGKYISVRRVEEIISDLGRKAIGKPVSPHWFRHSHITHALDGGASLPVVQATAGHSNLAVTGRYIHLRPRESSAQYIGDI